MTTRSVKTPAPAAAGILAAAVLVGLTACAPADSLCRAPSDTSGKCQCTTTAHGDTALVVLTDRASPAFDAAMKRITSPDAVVFEDGRIGLDGMPTVILASYDATGTVTELASYNLQGEGDTRMRKQANAELAAACLAQAADAVPHEAPGGNLVRAVPKAAALAEARGPKRAAVLAFGLGRSSLDDPTMDRDLRVDEIDLDTPEAQAHVIDVLRHVGVLPEPGPVAVTFVDPDEDVSNQISAGYINQFAEGHLCDAVAADRCRVLEVLP